MRLFLYALGIFIAFVLVVIVTNTLVYDDVEKPWWIGELFTVAGIFVGAFMIIFQLGKQHENELCLQKENRREDLKLRIYDEFHQAIEGANKKLLKAGMYAFMVPTHFDMRKRELNLGYTPSPVSDRANIFNNLHSEAQDGPIQIIKLIEKYEIVSPEIKIFQTALNCGLYDLRESFKKHYDLLLKTLPMDIVDGQGNQQTVNVIDPNEEQLTKIKAFANEYYENDSNLGNYIHDLNIELQKVFLSKIFDNEPTIRVPLDKKYKVITTNPEDIKELERYFNEDTSWGKNIKQVDEDVLKNLGEVKHTESKHKL